jgi:Uma2 family endonuclease
MARAYIQPHTDPPPLRMTYDEWQGWFDSDERNRGEWVKGEVIQFMPPLISHAMIVNFLNRLIGNYSDLYGLGNVFGEETELWLPLSQAARLPDVCYIAHQHRERISTHRLEGYADLVVEVISAESVTRDQRDKFLEYQAAGIPEYILVDPRLRHQTIIIYGLDDGGRYQAIAPDDAGRIWSRVLPGFWIDPAWLWQDPLPAPYQLIAQIVAAQRSP